MHEEKKYRIWIQRYWFGEERDSLWFVNEKHFVIYLLTANFAETKKTKYHANRNKRLG